MRASAQRLTPVVSPACTRKQPRDRSSLMNVGKRVDYALRALCYLAAQPAGHIVPRGDIQAHQAVPPHFLSKILRGLVEGGFLDSVPGSRGGFRLSRPPAEITIRAVYECVEGHLSLIACVQHHDCVHDHDDFCCFSPVCTQRAVWAGAQQVLLDYLDGITIGRIVDQHGLVQRLQRARRNPAARS